MPVSVGVSGGIAYLRGDSLIERGEHAELDASAQGWLSDEEAGERGFRIEFAVGEQPDFFELVGGQEVGFIDRHDDSFAAFVFFASEQIDGLGDE